MSRLDDLAYACRQAAGIAGNCERGNLLVDAATCLEECRDTGDLLAKAIAERDKALEERAEANRAALRFANREINMCRALCVADGGQWITDWEKAIMRVVKERNTAFARVRELEGLVADMLAESSRKGV